MAGNNLPILFKNFGSISDGNIIPESIIDGKNINWDIIVNFEVLFTNKPSTVPTDKHVDINMKRLIKYTKILLGITASKAIGARKNIISAIMKRWIKLEIKLLTIIVQRGIFPTIYAFFIGLLKNSTKGVGEPIIEPIVTPKTVIDEISVL